MTDRPTLRTFIAYVHDRPGVLARIAMLFRRRAWNIVSLTVGGTHVPGLSRMTIQIEADDDAARRVEANLYKLLEVLWVKDITREPSIKRDLALIKVRADATTRAQVLQLCEVFRAKTVDVSQEALVLEITGTDDKIQGFVDLLRPLGVVEMVSTGMIAITRGAEAPPVEAWLIGGHEQDDGGDGADDEAAE